MNVLGLNDEQQAFSGAIREFARRRCGTRGQRLELTQHGAEPHNPALYAEIIELGWPGVVVPEEYGGSGGGAVDLCVLLEESMRGLLPVNALPTTMVVAHAYRRCGNEDQKREILGGIARGAVESIAISEPDAGSDVAGVACSAEAVDSGWLINGQKTWCSNAYCADHILLVARTSRGAARHDGLTMFNVPVGTGGLDIRRIDTMGGREVCDLFFTDCRLPASSVVGTVDRAWDQLMSGLNVERLILAAALLGSAERTFDDLLAYVRERRQFGRPIGSFQALRHRIADLATELECARLLTYSVAHRVDASPDTLLPREASMAKLKATEVAKLMALEGMQMMGGYGYSTEYEMERHVRFALAGTIYGGTNEIQRDIIGKTFGL